MKSLISINNKFMDLNPSKIVSLILNSKYTKGIEMYINYENEIEKKYLDELVLEIKKNDLILQIHGDIEVDFNKQLEYIILLEKYSDYLGYPIVVTLHSIYNENEDVSLKKTEEYINNLFKYINNDKIIISLENLNSIRGFIRLGKESISPLVLNYDKLFFTYDIGHEISDGGNIIDLDKYMIPKIRNIHIHTINEQLNDHIPIYKNDVHWNKIKKGLNYLINNKYPYNIVYEYGLEYCNGKTIKEKIIDYLNSIDFVSEYINEE